MLNPSASDLVDARTDLEKRAAQALGMILFSFSRLDMNLGLLIVALRQYSFAPGGTEDVPEMNFHSRLQVIEKLLDDPTKLSQEARADLSDWVAKAHEARAKRNALVHGRWAVDPIKGKAMNMVGLPSSGAQTITEHSINELDLFNDHLKLLSTRLSKLRQRWKLP